MLRSNLVLSVIRIRVGTRSGMKWNLIEVKLARLDRPVWNAVLPCLARPDDNLIDSVSIIVIESQSSPNF